MTTNDKPFAPKATAVVALAALTASPLASIAESPGKNEVSGSLSYNDIENVSTTSATLSYGRYLTDMHQVGVTAGYVDMEYDGAGAGAKIYAFENAGINIGVAYQKYDGKSGWDDADGAAVNVDLMMRF
jgi:hypothetical protein